MIGYKSTVRYAKKYKGPRDHAPQGYRFLVQCVENITKAKALEWASRVFGRPIERLEAVVGHYPKACEHNSVFKPTGWMVFVKV